jgi:hypothetical protein
MRSHAAESLSSGMTLLKAGAQTALLRMTITAQVRTFAEPHDKLMQPRDARELLPCNRPGSPYGSPDAVSLPPER